MSKIGDKIKEVRLERGYTLTEAAKKANCTASTWRNWELGETDISNKPEKIQAVSEALNYDFTYFLPKGKKLFIEVKHTHPSIRKNTIGWRIREKRREHNYTLQDLALKIDTPVSTIRNWESGYTDTIKHTKIKEIAAALDVTPAYLLGWEDEVLAYKNIRSLPKTRTVPIIGEIACGQPIFAENNYDGEANVPMNIDADFALRCKGDSMINARIFNGDLVFIKQQSAVENGEIAAVLIDGEATLKRVYLYKDRIELRPENPTFPVLNYEGHALQEVRILGKAVAFLSMVR